MSDPRATADREAATEALLSVSRLMTAVVARTLADVRETVSVPQLRTLVMLHGMSRANLTAIADGLGVNPSNASRTCDKLVAQRLVDRVDDALDRRNVVITLTGKGRRLVESVMRSRRELLDELVAALEPRDQRRLARALAPLLSCLEDPDQDPLGLGNDSILHWVR